jgi:hypothetical protein
LRTAGCHHSVASKCNCCKRWPKEAQKAQGGLPPVQILGQLSPQDSGRDRLCINKPCHAGQRPPLPAVTAAQLRRCACVNCRCSGDCHAATKPPMLTSLGEALSRLLHSTKAPAWHHCMHSMPQDCAPQHPGCQKGAMLRHGRLLATQPHHHRSTAGLLATQEVWSHTASTLCSLPRTTCGTKQET